MKLKMARNSLFSILLRQPWWVSLAIAVGLSALAMALLPRDYKLVGALSSFPFVVISAMAAWRQRHRASPAQVESTQAYVAALNWADFAALLQAAFERDGYVVQRGSAAPVDFELERRGRKTLVSARRWKSARTGVEVLRALQAAREAAEASDALLVSLGELSDSARPFAARHGITVWQAAELAQALHPLPPRR